MRELPIRYEQPIDIRSSGGLISTTEAGHPFRTESPSGVPMLLRATGNGYIVEVGPEDIEGYEALSGDTLDLAGDKVAVAISNKELEDRKNKEKFAIKK